MEIFVSLATKILFPGIGIPENNIDNNFEKYIEFFNASNNEFIHSIYKFMIIHHFILKTDANTKCFQNETKMRKFDFLKRNIENIFFTQQDKEKFLEYFSKIQKHNFAFMRFYNIWKYKRSRITVSDDLYLNPIDVNGKNVFIVVQNKKKYLFSLANLINMVNSSLSNTSHFFSCPLILKNPYSNIVFNKSDLYNLYFAIKKSSFIMPVLYHYYFLTNFNITEFRDQYEGIIREISIDNHIKNSDCNTLYSGVYNMLKEHKPRINIHPDFPKEELVNIMRPYLRLYYISMYSLDEYKKLNAFSELHKRLHKFYRYNPRFGRKIVKRAFNSYFKYTTTIEFNRKYVNYNHPISIEKFMKNHEKCEGYNNEESSDEENESQGEINNRTTISDNGDMFRILLFQNGADTLPFQTQVENTRDHRSDTSEMDIMPYDNTGYSQRYSTFDEDSIYREITEDIISDNASLQENNETVQEDTTSDGGFTEMVADVEYDTESDEEIVIKNDSDSDTESDISE
jgi:hypothetical protein